MPNYINNGMEISDASDEEDSDERNNDKENSDEEKNF